MRDVSIHLFIIQSQYTNYRISNIQVQTILFESHEPNFEDAFNGNVHATNDKIC